MEYLLQLDQTLFQLINQEWRTAFLDWLLPLWRNKYFWTPLYLFLLFFLFHKMRQKIFYILFLLIATIGITDLTSSFLIKETVQRVRPCNDKAFMKKVLLKAPCGSGYSFTSSHAANHFCVAIFLIFLFGKNKKRLKALLLFWAASIAYAQVYVGVHYPADVLGGALLGCFFGGLGARILAYF